jgi:rubrerythrin
MKESIKFDLINNAKSSLYHAVNHLTNPDGVKENDLKFALRDVSHVVELLLKERLRRIHKAFIWQNVDKYPSPEAYTVDTDTAVKRLLKIGTINLDENDQKTIFACRKFRNQVEHYEFEFNTKETKAIIGRMLSFIFGFSTKHLGLELEEEFRADDRWNALIEIYEFWEAHSVLLEKKLQDEKRRVYECPSCGTCTFDIDRERCMLCGHHESIVICDSCKTEVFESEIGACGDSEGEDFSICRECIDSFRDP